MYRTLSKSESPNTRGDTRTRDGRSVVYETTEERDDRLRMERFADLVKQCLHEVLDEREQKVNEEGKRRNLFS